MYLVRILGRFGLQMMKMELLQLVDSLDQQKTELLKNQVIEFILGLDL